MKLPLLDDALETVVVDEAGQLGFQLAEAEVMGGEEGQAVILKQLTDELFRAVCLVLGVGAAQDLVDQEQGRLSALQAVDDLLKLFQLGHEIRSMFLQGI